MPCMAPRSEEISPSIVERERALLVRLLARLDLGLGHLGLEEAPRALDRIHTGPRRARMRGLAAHRHDGVHPALDVIGWRHQVSHRFHGVLTARLGPASVGMGGASGLTARQHDRLVTVGMVPSRPETGYGYIVPGPPLDEAASSVARFS